MVHRWASASNRRRVAEELATVLASTLVAIVAGIGILRLPDALRLVGLQRTDAWPSDATLQLASAIVVGGTLLVVLVRAIVRYRRRRTNALALARVLDRKHQTADLIATAIAVECGDASGNAELSVAVTQRAAQQLPAFGKPVVGFRAPATSLAALGIAAALVALIPLAAEADADGDADATAADDAIATPPLSAETLERLQDAAQMLARFEHKPGLKDSAREKLAQVRQQLDAIEADPDRSLSTLSKAEQALRELAEASRNEELFDEEKLGGMSSEELAEQMTRSLERGETDTAAAMAEEMARRLEDADEREMRSMARALERALERTPPSSRSSTTPGEPGSESSPSEAGSESSKSGAESGKSGAEAGAESGKSGSESGKSGSELGKSGSESGKSGAESGKSGAESGKSGAESGKSGSESGKSGSESGKSGSESGKSGSASSRAESGQSGGSERREAEDRARWRNKAEGLSERLRSGDSGTARSELEKMAEEMGKRAGKESMGRSLDRALSEVRKARSKQLSEMNGEGSSGKGEGEGKQGKGEGKGEGEGLGEGAGEGEGSAPGDGDGPPRIAAPFGPPSGKPGPGGGDGADDTKGDPTSMPEASAYAPERVQTDPDGPAQGAVRVIRRFTEGYHDSREYGDLHDKYSSIAESAVRQEEIPLTRRDYIRSYFQAVRGQ
jgi:hypothetical protein